MIPDEIYGELLAAISRVGGDITDDCETFLSEVRTKCAGSNKHFVEHVNENVGRWFRSVSSFPEWIQNAEWQFHQGKPMTFVGELQIPKSAGFFHDDACIYVFLAEDGITKTVIQVA